MTVDEHLLPTGEEPVSGIFDLRDNPTLEGRGFDDAWTDITNRGEDGSTSAVFTRPDGIKVTLTGDKTIIATWTPVLHHVVLMWHNSEGLFFYCSKGVHHGHART